MAGMKKIAGALSKVAGEGKATERGSQALQDIKAMIKPGKGVWDGVDPFDIWKAKQEKMLAELEKKKAESGTRIKIGETKTNKKKQFIDDVYKKFPEHPFDTNQRVISEGAGEDQKFAQFELKPGFGRDEVEIDWISAYPQRSGMGTKAIKALQQEAQDAGITLTLYPWDKGNVNQRALTSFYKKLGFEKQPGGSKTMIWRPEPVKAEPVETPAASPLREAEESIDPDKDGGLPMAAGGGAKLLKSLQKLSKEVKAAEKAGDLETAFEKQRLLNEAIRLGVNAPEIPRSKPLTAAEIQSAAERMAPQVTGELTRGERGAQTVAGKTQQQFKREQTLPVQRRVLPGAVDPMAPLSPLTLEQQKGSVLLGLPGDQSLARVELSGIGDVPFEQPVTLHGGPRYGDDEKLWASNLSAASGLLGAGKRASQQFGDAPVIASFMKMPSGLPFAQHYLESLLQYQRPDLLSKKAQAELVKDIRAGFVNPQGKKVTFPEFPGFGDLGAVADMALQDSGFRKHLADRLEKGKKYGLAPAADVQFAVSHPELTNLETGASGFTLGELPLDRPLTESLHPTYSHDIAGKVIGQTEFPVPYDMMFRDQLELIRQNPKSPEFNTLKLLGARQKIDEQLINEINEYQERMRRLVGKKPQEKAEGGKVEAGSPFELPAGVNPSNWREHLASNVLADAKALLGAKDGGVVNLDEMIDKAMGKKYANGGVVNLDEMIDFAVAKQAHKANGGVIKMADGGGEPQDRMFSPAPLTIPEPIKDLADAIKRQFKKEKRSLSKPGAAQDILLRGPVSFAMGAPTDILGMGGELLDYAQTKIPALRKPASVMDTAPQKTPTLGYSPLFPLTPQEPYGTEAAQELFGKAGLTTGEERPLFELGTGLASPFAMTGVMKAGKALAPTAMEMLDVQLANMMKPYQMNIVPEGGGSKKIKAPANKVGFYNPAEKAALNLERKKGTGDAFISDLKKQPGVTDERIAELGLDQLRGKQVTREEVIAATQQKRIPLRESVAYENEEDLEDALAHLDNMITVRDVRQRELDALEVQLQNAIRSGDEYNVNRLQDALRRGYRGLDEAERFVEEARVPRAMFAPSNYADYSMPNGSNYREIRVKLPKARAEDVSDTSKWSVETFGTHENGGRDIRITDDKGNWVDTKANYKGSDAKAIRDAAKSLADDADSEINYRHLSHHGTEPNVLFHLRVADHVDEEGKKGLLIDELQSDWHQRGREKGYGPQFEKVVEAYYETKGGQRIPIGFGKTKEEAEAAIDVGWKNMVDIKFDTYDRKIGQGVPDAPFKDNWYQLGLKRAIKEAVDTGMDRVYLTTGARQADRYDLSKHIDELVYQDGNLHGYKDGVLVIDQGGVSEKKLAEYVGKDAAKKLMEQEPNRYGTRSLSGLDLRVGGEGMKQWYDKNYKNYLDKYAKQHGSKLGVTNIKIGGENNNWPTFVKWFEQNYPGQSSLQALRHWDAGSKNSFVREFTKSLGDKLEPVYYIDITPEMRKSAKKGQSYAYGGGVFNTASQDTDGIYNTDPDSTDAGRIIAEKL